MIFKPLKRIRIFAIFIILIWKYTLRYNDVYFFDIWISKSNSNMVWFMYFKLF